MNYLYPSWEKQKKIHWNWQNTYQCTMHPTECRATARLNVTAAILWLGLWNRSDIWFCRKNWKVKCSNASCIYSYTKDQMFGSCIYTWMCVHPDLFVKPWIFSKQCGKPNVFALNFCVLSLAELADGGQYQNKGANQCWGYVPIFHQKWSGQALTRVTAIPDTDLTFWIKHLWPHSVVQNRQNF